MEVYLFFTNQTQLVPAELERVNKTWNMSSEQVQSVHRVTDRFVGTIFGYVAQQREANDGKRWVAFFLDGDQLRLDDGVYETRAEAGEVVYARFAQKTTFELSRDEVNALVRALGDRVLETSVEQDLFLRLKGAQNA